jgi:hypothetical protein
VPEALAECLLVSTRGGDRFGVALTTRTLGEYHLAWGSLPRARELLTEALGMWEELGLPLGQARTLRDLAAADGAADWGRAGELFAECRARESAEIAAWTPRTWLASVRRL